MRAAARSGQAWAGRRPAAIQTGFALVIVLWVLAGLTVVAVVVASSARVSNESVKLLRDRVQAEAAFLSTAARIRVIASTGLPRRMSIEGVKGRLLADGRSTLVTPGESVSIQDARGLINLNRGNEEVLGALIRQCGVQADGQVPELIDSLRDYIDKDNDKRLNGAEAFDYRLADLPEPRNAPLLSLEELWRVKGWSAIRERWKALGCDALVTTHGDGRFNQNTASAAALQATGITAEAAAAMVESRREGFEAAPQGAAADPFTGFYGGIVGTTLRVTHRLASVDWTLVYDLELSPARDGGPWRLHEIRYRPRPKAAAPDLAQLPAPDFELTDSERTAPNASFTPALTN